MDSHFEQARTFFLEGVQHYQAGRYEQAERQFAASLALVPGRPSTLVNLGAARLKLGRPEEALALLDEALAQQPDDADAHGHRGTALAELGRHEEALQALDRALALAPTLGVAWSHRGNVLRELGRRDEAIASFEQALAHGADPELNGYYLASLRGGTVPTATPPQYVEALFDGYAGEFDEHLAGQLRYDAPQVLLAHVQAGGRHFARALDLGCGTGQCGRRMKPLADAVDGVDLSANMLSRAQALGVYEHLEQGELAQYLASTGRRYELVVAGDVLVYVGDLTPVFAGVARVLAPGGVFCFTVERGVVGEDYALRESLRYAHSEPYLRALAQAHGFEVERLEERPVREDQREPIPGLFAWLTRR